MNKNEEYMGCCINFRVKKPCKAAEKTKDGIYMCIALTDTDFGNRQCPFYEEVEDERLHQRERYD